MEHPILSGRSGKRAFFGLISTSFLYFLCCSSTFAQVPTCIVQAPLATVHAEGIAEVVGDVTISCTGATAGAQLSPVLFVGLNTNVTNIVDDSGTATATLTVDTGSGPVNPNTRIRINGTSTLATDNFNITIPPSGQVKFVLSGIRANVSQLPTPSSGPKVVSATVVLSGGFVVPNSQVSVGQAQPSVLMTFLNSGNACGGSPVPATIDFPGLVAAGTAFSTLRVTEGFQTSFTGVRPGSTNGTRIVVKLTGYPTNGRIFVPDAIVGNTGSVPTSAGAFGFGLQYGTYIPGGAGSLLLARVNGADSNGVGGTAAFTLPTTQTAFSGASEVTMTNGAGTATYEILDGSAGFQEDAQIPVYLAVPQGSCTAALPTNNVTAQIGPISTALSAAPGLPVPRFLTSVAGGDCAALGDCNAAYFPQLTVDTTPVNLAAPAQGNTQTGYIRVGNNGAGNLTYQVSVTYPASAPTDWLAVSPSAGANALTLTVTADPAKLAQGVYTGNVVVNAGQFGVQTVAVTFTVGAPGVTIQSIVSAATFAPGGTLTAGSIASLFGLNLNGQNVSVTFDGLPATIFGVYNASGGQQQINLLVPTGLGSKTGASAVITVDGNSGRAYPVTLAPNSPGVFNPGILNQDFSVNSALSPAKVGNYVYVYMTGLTIPLTGAVTVKIGATDSLVPQYAGAAPTLTGVQQVNISVPTQAGGAAGPVPLSVCIPSPDGSQRICSPTVNLYLAP